MPDRIFGLDSTRALIAAQSCAAIIIGYGLALRYDWSASTVATTIIVLQTATLGTTLSKASLRMAGTLSGAVVGLTMIALCAHDRELFILGMALVTGACVWAMQSSTHQYAWLLVVVTSAVVGWPSAMNPLNAFQASVDRVTAVSVGVILSGIAHAVIWPVTASAKFERTMRELVESCRDLLLFVNHDLSEQNLDVLAIDKMESKIMALSTSLGATLHAARVESKRFHRCFSQYAQLCDQLEELFSATAAICDASVLCIRDPKAAEIYRSPAMRQAIDSSYNACVATVQQLSMPRDGTFLPINTENVAQDEMDIDSKGVGTSDLLGTSETSLLSERILAFRVIVGCVRTSLAEVETCRVRVPPGKAAQNVGPAIRVRLAKSALACLQVVLGAWFFIVLDWPLGLQSAMIPMMILAYMNAQLPVALVARTILLSIAGALPLAAVFHFLVMPGLDSFSELAPWLAVLFFPFLYGIASRNPLTSLAAVVSVIIVKSLISVSTAPPSYDFASFANTYIAMSGGFSLVLLLAYLFETRSPRRGFHKLLSVVLSQSANNLKELNNRSLLASERVSLGNRQRKQWLHSLGQLKKLSTTVDYRQDPHICRDQVEAVLQAFDVLAMRLTWAYSLNASSESSAEREQRAVRQAHMWCVESLTTTAQALTALQPVSIQQPSCGIFEDLKFSNGKTGQLSELGEGLSDTRESRSSLSAYYRSLADAILDCQSRLETVNWKRWCQNYF